MTILNIGCGEEMYGDVRVDCVKTRATTHVLDLNEPLPFPDGYFEEVYCKSVLEHIGNVKQFIEEAMRVLKKRGGKFWFRTDNASYLGFHWNSHQAYIDNEAWNDEDKHYFLFKEEHLRNLFGENCVITYSCPKPLLFFLPKKYKCMHLEVSGRKGDDIIFS